MRRQVAAVLAALGLAGCGGAAGTAPVATVASVATLPATAVSLPSAVKPLDRAFLAREAQAPALAGRLAEWGLVAAGERYFQGESRVLQVVDSRTLRFRSATGALEYVRFMRAHLEPILGGFAGVRSFTSGGRSGWVATAQECQCHLANPAFLAVVSRGATVTWLEINGPRASRRRLAALIALAP